MPDIKGKKIGAIDYGKKRIGFAKCDIFHVTVTPVTTFITTDANYFEDIINTIQNENIDALVIGIPLLHDNSESAISEEIKIFAEKLKRITGLNVYFQDEAYSSKIAVQTMVEIGSKKKKRRTKGSTDRFAAAIILRDFLQENES